MQVYRICLEKWSKQLQASGRAARWNSEGVQMIYTAESRSLACLENMVHRSGEGMTAIFRVMVIEVPDSIKPFEFKMDLLPDDWTKVSHYMLCRKSGDLWIKEGKSCILKVPSSIIKEEFNFLINPNHPDFKQIRVTGTEPFSFDKRFSGM
jgi:RES domain-containing protein